VAALDVVLRIVGVGVGAWIVASVVLSAVRTVVVPRGEQVALTALVFLLGRRMIGPFVRRAKPERREQILSRFAPVALLTLAGCWAVLVIIGFTPIYRSLGVPTWREALIVSGSSLTTLGFATASQTPPALVQVVEAIIGLGLVGLLISFLPTMYGVYSRRELLVAQMASRGGNPPTPETFIVRLHSIRGLDDLDEVWIEWENWFSELEETHTSYPSLVDFRSGGGRSWITAAGALLDSAAMITAAVDVPRSPSAQMCIRAGFLSLREIASFFRIPFDPDPAPDDPISVTREEFDASWAVLAANGVPMRADRDQAWRDWAGWRVNYDAPLLGLCSVVQPPPCPWSSDRASTRQRPILRTVWWFATHR
jgi:hypothetical protein